DQAFDEGAAPSFEGDLLVAHLATDPDPIVKAKIDLGVIPEAQLQRRTAYRLVAGMANHPHEFLVDIDVHAVAQTLDRHRVEARLDDLAQCDFASLGDEVIFFNRDETRREHHGCDQHQPALDVARLDYALERSESETDD